MRLFRFLPAPLLLAGCVAPPQAPPPPPPPALPAPPSRPPPPPPSADWRDVPISPGGWSYAAEPGGSIARFGPAGLPSFTVRCALATRQVTIAREGVSPQVVAIDVTTSDGRQRVAAQSLSGRLAVAAQLAANDPLLDRMAFSRGRFIVAAMGLAQLAIPSWPEFARVVEDCRG